MFINSLSIDGVRHDIDWLTIHPSKRKELQGKVHIELDGPVHSTVDLPIWFWWSRVPYTLKMANGLKIRRITQEEDNG